MSDTKISEAAVEAGALALSKYCRGSEVAWEEDRCSFRAALAAALPHIHPQPAELAEQKGVDMADADTVALEIARRFIPVDSPGAHNEGQQRAALQVAIVGVINAALAARQPGAQETVDVEAALAAGDPNWQAQCRPNLRGNERLFFAVRDIAEMRAMLAGEKNPLPGSGLAVVRVNPNAPSVVPYQCAHRLLGDAYQAGEKGGGFCDQAEELFVAMTAHAKRNRLAVVYAAPPAQRIDLGQFREPVEQWRKHYALRANAPVRFGKEACAEYAAKAKEGCRHLDLIDGQRDAAPGAQEAALWRNHSAAIDAKALATATEIALMWGQDRSQFVSRIQVAVIDAMRWMGCAAPPAQGIDLGQFREAVEAQHAALMSSWCGDPETKDAADQQRDRLLALIDQRDAAPGVGNGD